MKTILLIVVLFFTQLIPSSVLTILPKGSVAHAVSGIQTTPNPELQKIDNGISIKSVPVTVTAISAHKTVSGNNFSIVIPKIRLNVAVKANVDPANPAVYLPVLDHEVAHGMYTMLPDQAIHDGNVYLFAHRNGNSGYFHRLNELKTGDTVVLNYQGKTYTYRVYQSFVVNTADVWVYTGESAKPTLTLQTCENGTLQRLIVKAELVSISD
jgi:LPXTG-site transpeptidase (sortase) family protein